ALIAIGCEGSDLCHIFITLDYVGNRLLVFRHGLKGNILAGHGDSEDESAVLAGDEARRHGKEQIYRSGQHRQSEENRGEPMPKNLVQRVIVRARQGIETCLQYAVDPPVFSAVAESQIAAAQHWREGERDK